MRSFPSIARGLAVGGTLVVSLAAGAAQIVVGQVAPLSGLEGTQARAYSIGIQLALTKAKKGRRRQRPYLQPGAQGRWWPAGRQPGWHQDPAC